jgi:DNA (cytosine-5)-methyltransferase 1
MTLGFELAGFRSVFAVDHDRDSIKTYGLNFDGEAICGDIREVGAFPKTDVVVGGPPCQGFSRLGKQAQKPRHENLLWREYMRCVAQTKPKAFVVENVPDFLADAAWDGIQKESAKLGYRLAHGVLNAANYGVPQRRQRAIIIGCHSVKPTMPEPTHCAHDATLFTSFLAPWTTVRQAIGDLPLEPNGVNRHDPRQVSSLSLERYEHVPPGGGWKNLPKNLLPDCWLYKNPKSGGSTDMMGRLRWDDPALTIRTQFLKPEKGRYLHPVASRSLTVREGARLQTFPDDFEFSGSNFQAAKQIGNAVPPLLAWAIATHLAGLLGVNLPSDLTRLPQYAVAKPAGSASTPARRPRSLRAVPA